MFIGIIVELVIEIVVGILFTGGTLTVEAILVKLGETFKALGNLLIGVLKLPVKVVGKTVSVLYNALHWVYEFLAKGTDEILRIIDEVFDAYKIYLKDSLELTYSKLLPFIGAAEVKLTKKVLQIFFGKYGKLLLKYAKNALVISNWKRLDFMNALTREEIQELLEIRELHKKGFNKNAAIMKVEIEIDSEIVELKYKALAGDGLNVKGILCENANKDYVARELGMSPDELMKHFQTTDEYNKIVTRFHDSEHKIFSVFDEDLLKLKEKFGENSVKVKSMNFKTLYEPCNSCKKQIIIRHEMYGKPKVSVKAVKKNAKDFVKDNIELREILKL